ncbi:MAG: hypothetical protein WAK50_11440, partial [Nitrososphaeraceae archaeon]
VYVVTVYSLLQSKVRLITRETLWNLRPLSKYQLNQRDSLFLNDRKIGRFKVNKLADLMKVRFPWCPLYFGGGFCFFRSMRHYAFNSIL